MRTPPGGDYLHDDNYPKDRSSGPELDPQEDLNEGSFPHEIDDHPAVSGPGVEIDEHHLLPGSEWEGSVHDRKSE